MLPLLLCVRAHDVLADGLVGITERAEHQGVTAWIPDISRSDGAAVPLVMLLVSLALRLGREHIGTPDSYSSEPSCMLRCSRAVRESLSVAAALHPLLATTLFASAGPVAGHT